MTARARAYTNPGARFQEPSRGAMRRLQSTASERRRGRCEGPADSNSRVLGHSQLRLTKTQLALAMSLDEDELRGLTCTCDFAGEMGTSKLPTARLLVMAKVLSQGLRPTGTGAGAAARPIASLPQ